MAQTVDLETLGKGKALKLGGGISSSGIFYSTDQDVGREPFTYFLQGTLNISLYQFSMPIGYSYSNQGEQLNYDLPINLNRLSLHPKYKWVQGHIGDVAMSFSPYTLNGHQFTGGGVELTPKGKFSLSAMVGRLLKATEDDGNELTIPAFKRLGYGIKMGYQKDKYRLGIIGFYAKDNANSISAVPDERQITPKENMVISVEGGVKILDDLEVRAEYASSGITQDTRADVLSGGDRNLAGLFLNTKASTEFFAAMQAGLNYELRNSAIGITYERVEPGYETLGAYFFNNDLESITLNGSTKLLDNTMNVAFNIGYQRDDLNNQRQQTSNRTVGSLNLSYNPSEIFTVTASYSNFATFTNARLNQFEDINDDNLLDEAQLLEYRQLSQNANININYLLSQQKTINQNLNLNYSLADVSNAEDGVVRIGNASTFHNANLTYSLGFPTNGMNVSVALNGTLNTIGRDESTTWGPTLGINNKFFDNTLNTSLGISHNHSNGIAVDTQITNVRTTVSYVLKKKHSFNLNAIQLFKNLSSGRNRELTITLGHSYSF